MCPLIHCNGKLCFIHQMKESVCMCVNIPEDDEWPPIFSQGKSFLYLHVLTFLGVYTLFCLHSRRASSYFFSSFQTWGWNSSPERNLEILNYFHKAASLTACIMHHTATFFPVYLCMFIQRIHRKLHGDFTFTQTLCCLVASSNIYRHLSGMLNINCKGSVIPSHHPAFKPKRKPFSGTKILLSI